MNPARRLTNLEVVRDWIDSYNKRQFDKAGGFLAEDAIHDWVPDEIVLRGRDEIVQGMRDVMVGFPDLITKITNEVVDGEKVVVEVAWKGTFRGTFLGIAPTVKSFRLRAVFVFELEGGAIKSIREYYPSALLNEQLGIS